MHIYTSVIAVPLAFLQLVLGGLISLRRMRGEGDSESFKRFCRAFGNGAEHIPMVLIMLFLFESSGGDRHWIFYIGVPFILARVIHAIGISIRIRHPLQFLGASITYTVEAVLVVVVALRYLTV
jgi:uncharacterized membrane protein YecN with MAPEG domain